ncbi:MULTISPECIES: 4-hydroxy-tetrahydrodipicolinate reductase [unclassified Flavobacterium]|jgi:4-hydroxy-tetrahydrodipicolinate reductase|uniref:4-hydroxy-tetrahydrodipicolinate reductase n=1 Tax=unclassified Flavobacterium TaxID=196869 RepID=UPI00034BDE84|nr:MULTISPECIES: dihydrodipicolinate reductase C-terminal domain-containing protein [unclassified Flavobacterium]URC11252.1 dihydrodipicolinate reductase [Flavobacterium sp. B183]
MKIGLIGFGKTGKSVATVLLENNKFCLEWVLRQSTVLEKRSVSEFLGIPSEEQGVIYSSSKTTMEELLDKHPVDVIIDFSSNEGIYSYGEVAAKRKVKIISAISHYKDKELQLLKKLAHKTTVFWSPNITLGVNYLLFAAKFLKKIAPWVDIEVNEEHFKKKEGTSGTAVKIAEALEIDKDNINSVRAGGIVGKHEVIFGFPYQTVRLIHESISREAFGNGVVFVAENLKNKPKGLYNFEDILTPYFTV